MSTARRLEGSGFGHAGGSNLADYLSATERAHQIELEMEAGEQLVEIPVDLIDRSPFQARATFDPEEITALGEDIQEHGLNHPVTVREGTGGRYELVAGERRWLAAKQAGLTNILARVRSLDDFTAHLVGVSENNRRANLSAWEMSIEAARLLQHAKSCDRPHTQRDLARYLNRNVSLVNHQLAIAAAITPRLLVSAQVREEDACRLPHLTLSRIAKLPASRRARALKEAIRMLQNRGTAAKAEAHDLASFRAAEEVAEPDEWKRLWETGGFQIRLQEPLRNLDPDQAQRYAHLIALALGGLAARVAEGGTANTVIQWETPEGRLLFVRPLNRMSDSERHRACESLDKLLDGFTTPAEPVRG